ncbi:hypothetical protein MUK42_03905 [Musa troglodytarum]|uniref:Uncharacterized protein n=1 Tax=Musa troglodytarum TaxID=320322 RepID=A0A9E7G729_9LILI|nr:hypothetical protein MUK42_03905 [Musa troglodytarum]
MVVGSSLFRLRVFSELGNGSNDFVTNQSANGRKFSGLISDFLVADTEEYIDRLFTGNLGELSTRVTWTNIHAVNCLYSSKARARIKEEPYHHPARRKRQVIEIEHH